MAFNDFIRSIGLIGGEPDEGMAQLASAFIQQGMTRPAYTGAQSIANALSTALGMTAMSNQAIRRQARQKEYDRKFKEAAFGVPESGVEIAAERFGGSGAPKPSPTPKLIPPEVGSAVKAVTSALPIPGLSAASAIAGIPGAISRARGAQQSSPSMAQTPAQGAPSPATRAVDPMQQRLAAKKRMNEVVKVMMDSPNPSERNFAKEYILNDLQNKGKPNVQVVGGAMYNFDTGQWMVPPKQMPTHIVAKPGDTVLFPGRGAIEIPNTPGADGFIVKEVLNKDTGERELVHVPKMPGGTVHRTGLITKEKPSWIDNLPPTAKTAYWKMQDDYVRQVQSMRENVERFDESFLTAEGRLKYRYLSLKDLLSGVIPGIDELNEEDRQLLERQSEFLRTSYDQFNTYVKAVTGAQMSIHEIARLKKAIAQPGDTPTQYAAKMMSLMKVLERTHTAREAMFRSLASGEDFDPISSEYLMNNRISDIFEQELEAAFPEVQIFGGPEEADSYNFWGDPTGEGAAPAGARREGEVVVWD